MAKHLILGSSSPRRKVILQSMGMDFEVVPSAFDEWLDDAQSVESVAMALGLGKANDVAQKHPDAYVIGSDAIVAIDGHQLAKPADADEARMMLHSISGRSHQVITSVALVCLKDSVEDVRVDTATITFKPLPDALIEQYIATGDPYDKAGGYARQHPLLAPYIEKVEGDIFTVTGLPVKLLILMLQEHGFTVPNSYAETTKRFYEVDPSEQRILI